MDFTQDTLLGRLNPAQVVLVMAALNANADREHTVVCPATLTAGGFCTCGKWDAEMACEVLNVPASNGG